MKDRLKEWSVTKVYLASCQQRTTELLHCATGWGRGLATNLVLRMPLGFEQGFMKPSAHSGGLLHRELPKPSRELAGVKSHDELQTLLLVRRRSRLIAPHFLSLWPTSSLRSFWKVKTQAFPYSLQGCGWIGIGFLQTRSVRYLVVVQCINFIP